MFGQTRYELANGYLALVNIRLSGVWLYHDRVFVKHCESMDEAKRIAKQKATKAAKKG